MRPVAPVSAGIAGLPWARPGSQPGTCCRYASCHATGIGSAACQPVSHHGTNATTTPGATANWIALTARADVRVTPRPPPAAAGRCRAGRSHRSPGPAAGPAYFGTPYRLRTLPPGSLRRTDGRSWRPLNLSCEVTESELTPTTAARLRRRRLRGCPGRHMPRPCSRGCRVLRCRPSSEQTTADVSNLPLITGQPSHVG